MAGRYGPPRVRTRLPLGRGPVGGAGALADHEHRARGVVDHVVADRAQQHPLEGALAVGPDDDDVGADVFGHEADHRSRVAGLEALDDGDVAEDGGRLPQDLAGLLLLALPGGLALLRRLDRPREAPGLLAGHVADHRQQHDLGRLVEELAARRAASSAIGDPSVAMRTFIGAPCPAWRVAEGEGFEPSRRLHTPYSLSRRALSAAQSSLRERQSIPASTRRSAQEAGAPSQITTPWPPGSSRRPSTRSPSRPRSVAARTTPPTPSTVAGPAPRLRATSTRPPRR